MTKDQVFQFIKEVFDNLGDDLVDYEPSTLNMDTYLVGSKSPLDSIGFVTFITDLEERLIQETGYDDIHLSLDEIDGYDPKVHELTVEMLIVHIVKFIDGKK